MHRLGWAISSKPFAVFLNEALFLNENVSDSHAWSYCYL